MFAKRPCHSINNSVPKQRRAAVSFVVVTVTNLPSFTPLPLCNIPVKSVEWITKMGAGNQRFHVKELEDMEGSES